MQNFIIKIEIFGAEPGDYEQLHNAMVEKGFTCNHWDNASEEKCWSDTEYFISGELTANSVMDKALEIANKVKANPFVSVTKAILQVATERWGEAGNSLPSGELWGANTYW
ncbi:hypothetical protein D3C79_931360 [compost metagenome]